jgi:AraC-like DNA-binding protein
MKRSETIREFYQTRYPSFPANGQFNVFERMALPGKCMSYNKRDFYKVSLVVGTGVLRYANRDIIIDRPALLFSNPLMPYSWEAVSEKQAGYSCIFTEAFLKNRDRNIFHPRFPLFSVSSHPVYFLNEQQQVLMDDIFRKMLAEIRTDYIHKYDLLINYVNIIIHEAVKMEPDGSQQRPKNAAARIASLFTELLNRQFPIDSLQHSLQLKTAAHYADSLCIHVNYLNYAVRETTGKTTTEHITAAIISEARALLSHTCWSISDIAYCLGFESPTYFNQFFKKQTGITPTSIRKEYLEQH